MRATRVKSAWGNVRVRLRQDNWCAIASLMMLLVGVPSISSGQIGGRTGADGTFLLEDAEDLDLTATGVGREWVPEFIFTQPNAFEVVSPAAAGVSLAPGQSATGVLRYTMPTTSDFIDYSFGVPMPSVAGASTATFPGNLSTFASLTFLTCYSQTAENQQFLVILECYPRVASSTESEPVYPKLFWSYSIPAGTTFQSVSVDLRAPSQVENPDGIPLAQLLAQTRFLAFSYFGGPEPVAKTVTVHVDDIQLEPLAGAQDWALYD